MLREMLINWVKSRSAPKNVVSHDTRETAFHRYAPFWEDEFTTKDGRTFNRPPWWRPFNILFHNWLRVPTEAMHDHPRWSITICLKGKIIERTPWRKRTLTPGSIVIRSRKYIHGFELPEEYEGKTWTIFIVGRRNHAQNGYIVKPFGERA